MQTEGQRDLKNDIQADRRTYRQKDWQTDKEKTKIQTDIVFNL